MLATPFFLWPWFMRELGEGLVQGISQGSYPREHERPHDYHYTLIETEEFGSCLYRQDHLARNPDERVLLEKCVSQFGQTGPWTLGESGLGWFVYHQSDNWRQPTYFTNGREWLEYLLDNKIDDSCVEALPPCDCDYGRRARAIRAEVCPP
jgi:hypothetical protein